MVGLNLLFPVDIIQCPVLPAIVSQLYTHRDYMSICGRQDGSGKNRSAANFLDSHYQCTFFAYEIINM
jgi:hypothetical protein